MLFTFSGDQIIGILKEQEAEFGTADLCRKHGIGIATWKASPCRGAVVRAGPAARKFAIELNGFDEWAVSMAQLQRTTSVPALGNATFSGRGPMRSGA